MKISLLSLILIFGLTACAHLQSSTGPRRTPAHLRPVERYLQENGLEVNVQLAQDLLTLREENLHLIVVRVTSQHMRLDETPGEPPIKLVMEAEVLDVIRGEILDPECVLVSSHNAIPHKYTLYAGREYFVFFEAKSPTGNIPIPEGNLREYHEDLRTLLADPNAPAF